MKIAEFKKGMGLLAAAVIMLSAISVYAQPPEGEEYGHKRSSGEQKEHIKEARENLIKELGLSPEQEEKLKQNRQAHRDEIKELMTVMKVKQGELRQQLEKYDSDQAKIDAIASEIKSYQAQMVDLRIAKITSVKSILTQEQFAKFKEKIKTGHGKNGKGKFKGRMKRWHGKKDRSQSQPE